METKATGSRPKRPPTPNPSPPPPPHLPSPKKKARPSPKRSSPNDVQDPVEMVEVQFSQGGEEMHFITEQAVVDEDPQEETVMDIEEVNFFCSISFCSFLEGIGAKFEVEKVPFLFIYKMENNQFKLKCQKNIRRFHFPIKLFWIFFSYTTSF
jgi:hypothetical protein